MLTRPKRKEYYYDKLHRGFVNICMATTVVAGMALIYKGYVYFTQVLPEQKLLIQKKEAELLDEGKDIEDSVLV